METLSSQILEYLKDKDTPKNSEEIRKGVNHSSKDEVVAALHTLQDHGHVEFRDSMSNPGWVFLMD